MSFTIDKKLGRNIKRYNVYTKEELDGIFGGNIANAGEAIGRQAELSEKLDELNDDKLLELSERIDLLNDFLEDPESLPEGSDYITQLLVDDLWADNVTAVQGWFDMITGNSLFVDKMVANEVFADTAVLNELFAQDITVTGTISGNYSAGSTGWRIRSNGSAEFNNVDVRGGGINGSLGFGGKIGTNAPYGAGDIFVALGSETGSTVQADEGLGLQIYVNGDGADSGFRLLRAGRLTDKNTPTTWTGNKYGFQIGFGTNANYKDVLRFDEDGFLLTNPDEDFTINEDGILFNLPNTFDPKSSLTWTAGGVEASIGGRASGGITSIDYTATQHQFVSDNGNVFLNLAEFQDRVDFVIPNDVDLIRFNLNALPTFDPGSPGQLYRSGNSLNVSI